MKYFRCILVLAGALCFYGTTTSADEMSKSPIPKMSKEQLIKLALSAAPEHISKDATVMIPDADGKMVEVKKGTNGFICLPDIDGQEKPDPICGDAATFQWANDYMSNAPKPSNTVPGIAYMGQGGWHWEKNGRILLDNEDKTGAKRVKEPAHWMLFWPVGSEASGIPPLPNKWGTYVMFDGTPYAHLMIYQNPNKLKPD